MKRYIGETTREVSWATLGSHTEKAMLAFGFVAFVIAATVLLPVESFVSDPPYRYGVKDHVGASNDRNLVLYPVCIQKIHARIESTTLKAQDSDDEDMLSAPSTSNDMQIKDNTENDEGSDGWMTNLMKETQDLVVGDWIVAKREVASLGIRAGAVYKLISMYLKGSDSSGDTGLGVEVIPLEQYGDDSQERFRAYRSYTKYLQIYNPRDHDGNESTKEGVLVTPEEIGLVSVKADWTEALYLAVPGFFWVFVASAFSNYYTDRYGGSFWDAFFRT